MYYVLLYLEDLYAESGQRLQGSLTAVSKPNTIGFIARKMNIVNVHSLIRDVIPNIGGYWSVTNKGVHDSA